MEQSLEAGAGAAPRVFYGWVIVGLCFLLQGVAAACTQYLVGVFAVPFADEFGGSRAGVLFATTSVMAIAGGVLAPPLGALLRRRSIRWLLVFSVGWLGCGFAALAATTALWQVGAVYALAMSVGMTTINLGTNTLAATWFSARRGRALGFVAAGTSAFGFLLPPLVSHGVAALGWRTTCVLLALLLWLVVPLVARLLVDRPEQRGLLPDGASPVAGAVPPAAAGAGWTVRALLGSARFWLVVLPVGLCLASAVALLTNLIPVAMDAGVGAQAAAYLTSVAALCSLSGKIVFGFAADRIGQRRMVWLPAGFIGATCLLLVAGSPGYPQLLAGALALGLGLGAATPAWGALVALHFGRDGFSLAMGLMSPVLSVLLAASVPFAGWVYDRTGSYDDAWLTLLAALLLAAACGRALPAPPERAGN